jgi:hypothetical protein
MDPVSTSLVLAGVKQALDSTAGEAGKEAWQGFVGLVRRAFNRPDAVVEPAQAESLAAAVAGAARLDPALAAEVRGWLELAGRLGGQDSSTTNSMSGVARNVVQARDIHGGITLH